MASDLISREALRNSVLCWRANNDIWRAKPDTYTASIMINFAIETINEAPDVDAELVQHGYWVEVRDKHNRLMGVKCSKCGRRVKNGGENYCPRCGAKMYGGKT